MLSLQIFERVGIVRDDRAHGRARFQIRAFAAGLNPFFQRALADDKTNMLVSGLVSYMSHDEDIYEIEADPTFTIRALYRLGFKWPATDKAYLKNAIEALKSLNFFDEDAR